MATSLSKLNSILDWNVRVCRMFGIPIHLHITILVFLYPVLSGRGLGIWLSLEYVLAVVASILLHELGHALTAKRYRMTGLSIMLHGFGGFAVSSGFRTPKQALVITLAGPAVTLALGFLLLGLGSWLPGGDSSYDVYLQLFILGSLGRLNLLMGVLNLLPILPWDGGNALVAILTRPLGDFKAMRAVAHVGMILAPIVAIYGLANKQGFLTLFGVVGLLTSWNRLTATGGIRFGEFFADWKSRRGMAAARRQEAQKKDAYLMEIRERERQRLEKERLRKIFESSLKDEP